MTGEAYTHKAPGEEVCDFCNALLRDSPQVWTHFTVPHEFGRVLAPEPMLPDDAIITTPMPEGVGSVTTHYMDEDGEWAACMACHSLIEADSRDALLERSVKGAMRALIREYGPIPTDAQKILRSGINATHRSFFAHRTDRPPERIS